MPATLTCSSVLACGWMVIRFHLGASKLLTLWVTCSFLERKKGAEIGLSLTLTAVLPGEALLEACGPTLHLLTTSECLRERAHVHLQSLRGG